MMFRAFFVIVFVLVLQACQENEVVTPPPPIAMTNEAVGHYCQMDVLEHSGPKAQIHLAKHAQPIWFSQVRDAIAYMRLPEETDEIRAVYVHDMGIAKSWEKPGLDNWVDANKAYFVIDSRKSGGMGAPEAVPFAGKSAAKAFVAQYGGKLASLADIPDSYVLAPVTVSVADEVLNEGIKQ